MNTENQEVPTHTHGFEALNGSTDGLEGGDVNTDGLDDVDENTEVEDSNDLNGEVYSNALEGEEEYNDLLEGDDEYPDDDVAEYTNTLDDLSGMLDGNGNSPVDHNMSDVEEGPRKRLTMILQKCNLLLIINFRPRGYNSSNSIFYESVLNIIKYFSITILFFIVTTVLMMMKSSGLLSKLLKNTIF